MPQYDHSQDRPRGLPGTFVRGDRISMPNPVLPQITEIDMNADTSDGTYAVEVSKNGQVLAVSDDFVATGLTAAAIAAGISASCLTSSTMRGLLSDLGSDVSETDSANLYFRAGGVSYDVRLSKDPTVGVATVSNRQNAGFTAVGAGELIQSDDLGGFEAWDGDGPAALGIVLRNSEVVNQPYNTNAASAAIDAPVMLDVLRCGEADVQLADGVTVKKGDGPAYYNGTTKTWSNAAAGSHVIVEGSMWMTGGTGVQTVFAKFPLEA